MAERDERSVVEYAGPDVRTPRSWAVPAGMGWAVGFAALTLGTMVPDLHNYIPLALIGLWSLAAVATAVMLRRAWVREKGKRGAMILSIGLAVLALLIGSLGATAALFGTDPHISSRQRIYCQNNMKQMGTALLIYGQAHGNQLPGTLEELFTAVGELEPEAFVCPTTKDTPATGANRAAVARALTAGGHLSYCYMGAGLTLSADPDTVVMYEPMGHHPGIDEINVLFGDGHVDSMRGAEARELLDRVASGERPVVWKGSGVRPTK